MEMVPGFPIRNGYLLQSARPPAPPPFISSLLSLSAPSFCWLTSSQHNISFPQLAPFLLQFSPLQNIRPLRLPLLVSTSKSRTFIFELIPVVLKIKCPLCQAPLCSSSRPNKLKLCLDMPSLIWKGWIIKWTSGHVFFALRSPQYLS